MAISDFFKRFTSPDKYNEASVKIVEGTGRHGAKQPPFDQRIGVRSFHSWVHAAASINAFACAATPLRLYMRQRTGKKLFASQAPSLQRKKYLLGDGPGNAKPSTRTMRKLMEMGEDFEEVVDSHPIIDLLHNVNPVYNGFDLMAQRILYGELTGNSYMAVIFDEALGVPTQLWPMPSQWTTIVPDRKEFVKGYVYGAPGNEPLEFGRDEVIHFRRPNPADLFYGMGKVEAAWGTIGINDAIHEMDASTYENHARPDYAVVVKGPSGESSLKRFEEYVAERLQGTRKSGKFLAMTGDVQLTPLNFPPKDLTGRDEVVEEIAAVFGVPVSLLKANDPNLASARTGYSQWREGTILPLLRMDEDELNQTLIPMFGLEGEAVLAYDNPVPRDEQFDLSQMQAAVSGGWMTINEARLKDGREAYDHELADEPLINGMPLGGGGGGMGMGMGMGPGMGMDLPSPEALPPAEETEGVVETEEPAAQPSADVGISVETSMTLNGAQVSSMMKVLQGVSDGTITSIAAIEVIVALGVERSNAERMVEAQATDGKPVQEVEAEAEKPKEEAPEQFTKNSDCVASKIPKLIDEGYSPDQAVAIALSMCEEKTQDGVDRFDTPEEAEEKAEEMGCSGHHVHEEDGKTFYMPCDDMEEYEQMCSCEGHAKHFTDLFDKKPTAKFLTPWGTK